MGNDLEVNRTLWDPMKIFSCSPYHAYGVIILNQPILINKELMLPMWRNAQVTICVDGGSNEWIKYLNRQVPEIYRSNSLQYTPIYIVGDLDSIPSNKIKYWKNLGVNVIETPDQNNTDYTKSLMFLKTENEQKNIHLETIYVIVETSGRMDHVLGNISTLYKCKRIFDNSINVIHVTSNSLIWLLKPGKHIIKIPELLREHNSWVGLIPFNAPNNKITTTGLKWNLDNTTLNFDGKMSTSNTYDGAPEVTVTTNAELLWTMGIEPLVENISTIIPTNS